MAAGASSATDRDAAGLARLADELGAALLVAPAAATCAGSRSADGGRRPAVAAAGRLDCLVNAAGLWTEGPADETREADFDRVLGVNLKGLYFLSAAAIPHLERDRRLDRQPVLGRRPAGQRRAPRSTAPRRAP